MVAARLDMRKKKGPGRPKKDDDGTRMLRISVELADKIAWIVRIRKKADPSFTAAQLVEPLIRPQINTRYAAIEADVEAIKAAERSAGRKSEDRPDASAE